MARHKGKPKTGICVLCGKFRTITREHVPPKGLFLKPRPDNTITVPLCRECNHSYHLDDEYFRVLITLAPNPSDQQFQLWDEKVQGSSFRRSRGLKARIQDEYRMMQEYAKTHDFRLYDGRPIPQEMKHLIHGVDARRISSVVDKIVRCLYYYHFSEVLSSSYSIEVCQPVPLNQLGLAMPPPKGQVGHKGEFLYWQFGHTDPNKSVWLLAFYQYHAFAAEVTNSQPIPSPASPDPPRDS